MKEIFISCTDGKKYSNVQFMAFSRRQEGKQMYHFEKPLLSCFSVVNP